MLASLLLGVALAGTPELPNETWIHDKEGSPVRIVWGQTNLPNLSDYRQTFEAMDVNEDGLVHPDELPPDHALQSEWHLADRNHDGILTPREWAAFH